MIWKQRLNNGVRWLGGQAECMCHGGDVAGVGVEGKVLEAMRFSDILKIKGMCVLANHC